MYKQPASRTDNLPVHAALIAGVEDTEQLWLLVSAVEN